MGKGTRGKATNKIEGKLLFGSWSRKAHKGCGKETSSRAYEIRLDLKLRLRYCRDCFKAESYKKVEVVQNIRYVNII